MADPPILVPPKMVKLEDLHHHALEQLPNLYLRACCNASCCQHGMLPTIAFFLYSRATAQPSNHTLTTREREREREGGGSAYGKLGVWSLFVRAMADLADLKALHGVCMPWNVWPTSKAEATKCVVPLTVIVTPLHAAPALTVLPYGPLRCKSCRSLLNPFCRVDFQAKLWICPFCLPAQPLPTSLWFYFGY